MLTATAEKINSELEQLDTSVESSLGVFRILLDDCGKLAHRLSSLRQSLHDNFKDGLERAVLPQLLARVRHLLERYWEFLRRALPVFQGGDDAVIIETYLREVDDFLAWVRALEPRVAMPPPFDESRLPPPPSGPTAEGYVSVSEARTRLHARKKP